MNTQVIVCAWGVRPLKSFQEAYNYTCPHCGNFSAFCRGGDFPGNTATIWRQAVVGFEPCAEEDVAGTAVLRCNSCGVQFVLRLNVTVLDAYATDCPLWPK